MMPDNVSNNVETPEVVPPKPDNQSVAFETYQKVLSQRKADQVKLKELQESHNAMLAEKQSAEDAAKAEQGRFEELFQTEQKKAQDLQANIDSRILQDVTRSKKNALKVELQGLRKDEYLQFADVNSIVMDDNGVIDIESVKNVASTFRESYSDLFAKSSSLPDSAPGKGPQTLTYDAWMKLPASEKATRSHEVKD